MDIHAIIDDLQRKIAAKVEALIKRCVTLGFHVEGIESTQGEAMGSVDHPIILRGAYGRELARWWIEGNPETYQYTWCMRVAADVQAADLAGGEG